MGKSKLKTDVKEVLVIGGGIVGLSSAYFLHKQGCKVTVVDKSAMNSGASFVNAGYLTPSHIIPLAAPGMISMGLRMMFNAASPFYMKPRWDIDFFKWARYFHRSSTEQKVAKAIPVIKDINILSQRLYHEIRDSGDLGDFQLEQKGLLMLYQKEASFEHEMEVARKAAFLGLEVTNLDRAALAALEPDIEINAKGAIHYKCDGHTTPGEIMPKLIAYLKRVGVSIRTNEEVEHFGFSNKKITSVRTNKGVFAPEAVVLAAGSWSGLLAKQLRLKLPLQAGKGYRINVKRPTGIRFPAILMEAKMAVTPMAGFTRFAGTMEFSGINTKIRKERVMALAKGANRFYPQLQVLPEEREDAQTGMRPVSPDGLPYIGKTGTYDNLVIATGHAMMGWSLGPATGKIIAQLVTDTPPEMDITAFHPDRRF
ncbi:NAD(P)/FAD-dependent oxidoreductase [Maribacter sp. 2-571]|uniref:NAD(P)/FAD-dependent oxidoreductase n=1 Tax=Maribacter sp. 2-571 TaxID=3417569 RepID=UPI003D32E659